MIVSVRNIIVGNVEYRFLQILNRETPFVGLVVVKEIVVVSEGNANVNPFYS